MMELIILLSIIEGLATDLHYNASGPSFYGMHLMADRVREPIHGFIDSIIEVAFLGNGLAAPSAKAISERTATRLPALGTDAPTLIKAIDSALATTIAHITKTNDKLPIGEQNLVGGIAESLQQSRGFIHRSLLPTP
jgi:DNA-binding ferritin-like protein